MHTHDPLTLSKGQRRRGGSWRLSPLSPFSLMRPRVLEDAVPRL